MAPTAKTNFKTYEASTRLLAAVIATNKIKLDFKELATHVGGGATKDAINHRLRPIKQLAKMQAACVAKGEDPGDLPIEKGVLASLVGGGATESSLEHRMRPIKQLAKMQLSCQAKGEDPGQLPIEKGEIQRLFGESTPGGIEWQFRDIKAIGRAQADALAKGENPAGVTVPGTPSSRTVSTPGSRASKASAATPRASAVNTPSSRVRTQKRKRVPTSYKEDSLEDEDEADDTDYDAKDALQETPSRHAAAKKSRLAAGGANSVTPSPMQPSPVKPANASGSDLSTSRSIFGNGGGGTSFSQPPAGPASSGATTRYSNPFDVDDDDPDALQIIDVSQAPGQQPKPPKPKVIKQEPKPRSDPAPASGGYVDPYAGIALYGYNLEDGEI